MVRDSNGHILYKPSELIAIFKKMDQESEVNFDKAMARIRSVMTTAGLMNAEIMKATKTTREEITVHDQHEVEIDKISEELSQKLADYEASKNNLTKRQLLLDAVKKSQILVQESKRSAGRFKKITKELLIKVEKLAMESTNLIEASNDVHQYIDAKTTFIQAFYDFSSNSDQTMSDDKYNQLGQIVQLEYKRYKQVCNPCIWCLTCNRICHSRLQEKDIGFFKDTDIPLAIRLQSDIPKIKAIIERVIQKCPEGVSEEFIKGVSVCIPKLRDSIVYGQKGQSKHTCCIAITTAAMSSTTQQGDDAQVIETQHVTVDNNATSRRVQPRPSSNQAELDRIDDEGSFKEKSQVGRVETTSNEKDDELYLGKRKGTIKNITTVYEVIEPEKPADDKVYICGAKNKRCKVKLQPIDAEEENGWLVCKEFKLIVVPSKPREKIQPEDESLNDDEDGNDGDDDDAGSQGGGDDADHAKPATSKSSRVAEKIALQTTARTKSQLKDGINDDAMTSDTLQN